MTSSTEIRHRIEVGDAASLLVVVIWAANNVLTKAALNHGLEALAFVASRFIIVAVVLGIWLAMRGQLAWFDREDLGRFFVSGALGYTTANLLFVVGLSHTTAFASSVFGSTGPIFMLLFAAIIGMEQVRPMQWIGVAIAFAGVGIFVADKLSSGAPAVGDLLNIGSAASFAAFSLISRPLTVKYGAPTMIFWSVTIGTVLILPIAAPTLWNQDWQAIGSIGVVSILYASLASMLAGYVLWSWAMARHGPGRTAPFMFLIPPIAGLLAWIFLDERINAWQLAGAACILFGVFLALHSARRASARRRMEERTGTLPARPLGVELGTE